jgi:hypothetical protein
MSGWWTERRRLQQMSITLMERRNVPHGSRFTIPDILLHGCAVKSYVKTPLMGLVVPGSNLSLILSDV